MKLYDNASAARYIGVTPGTLCVWRTNGRSPKYIKVGVKVRYSEDDLNAWLAERTRTSTTHHTELARSTA